MRRRRGLVVAIAVLCVLAVVGGVLTWTLLRSDDGGDADAVDRPTPPSEEVRSYLAAWEAADWDAMAALVVDPPGDFAERHTAVVDELRVTDATYDAVSIALDEPPPGAAPSSTAALAPDADATATATFTATLTLDGLGEWAYDGEIRFARVPAPVDASTTTSADTPPPPPRWRVVWSPAAIHPELADGFHLDRQRSWPDRAPVLDGTGAVLAGASPLVDVGIEPRRVTDRDALAAAVARDLGLPPADLFAAIDAPGVRPDFFVSLATLPPPEWEAIEATLLPVPGVVIRDTVGRIGPEAGFARHVLGRTGEATAERLEELGPPYRAGDVVGFGGVEGRYEDRLAGRPSGAVRLIGPADGVVGTLHEFPGVEPEQVQVTVVPDVQRAAEGALDGVTQPAALVAIEATTGRVVAAVSRPTDGFDRALQGRYAPGSTFKVVTTVGLLGGGTTVDTVIACPGSIEIGGRTIRNFEGGALGDIPFSRAFTASCNTAFIGLADGLGAEALEAAARDLGFGVDYDLGLSAFGGSYPTPADRTEDAAAAIGQGRVEANAVHMASVAAAIVSGTWRPPLVVAQPVPDERPEPVELAPPVALTTRALMVQTVQGGTATGAAIPGREIGGKTGTAQFDTDRPDVTHAWFIGFEGDLAFAVLVEEGGVGGQVAAPIARRFLELVPR